MNGQADIVTDYPFPLPATLIAKLPTPTKDNRHYLDVRVAGVWDGVLVFDGDGMCIGVYLGRQVRPLDLTFSLTEIEDIRPASRWNLTLASFPFDLWDTALLTILVVSPIALLLGWLVWSPLALVSIFACSFSIYILYLAPGFPLIRLPVALIGVLQIVLAVNVLLFSLLPRASL